MKTHYRSFFSPLFLPLFWLYGLSMVLMIIASVGALYPPHVYKKIYDNILPQEDYQQLIWIGISIALVYIGISVISWINNYINAYANVSLHNRLRIYLFKSLVSAPYRELQGLGIGQVLGRFQSDLGGIAAWLSILTGTIASSIATLLTVSSFIYILDYRLLIGVLPTLPFYIVIIALFKDRIFARTLEVQQSNASILHKLNDFIHGLRAISLSLSPRIFLESLRNEQHKALKASLKMSIVNSISNGLSGLVGVSGPTAMLVYGGYLVMRHEISIGTLIAFMTVVHRIYQSLNMLFSVRLQQYSIKANIARIDELVARIPAPRASTLEDRSKNTELLDYTINLSDVGLMYGQKNILKDVNFTIPMGATCLIRGPNGSGKSSLAELIAGLQNPTQGKIMFGSKLLNDLSPQQSREIINIVPQKPYVFNMPLRDNLVCANTNVSEKDVRKVMNVVGLSQEVANLSTDDLKSMCGDGEIIPSGGEIHRIALARSLLCDPKILILDETFSSLPKDSGNVLIRKIREQYKDITIIIVSHRPLETAKYSMEIALDFAGRAEVRRFNVSQ